MLVLPPGKMEPGTTNSMSSSTQVPMAVAQKTGIPKWVARSVSGNMVPKTGLAPPVYLTLSHTQNLIYCKGSAKDPHPEQVPTFETRSTRTASLREGGLELTITQWKNAGRYMLQYRNDIHMLCKGTSVLLYMYPGRSNIAFGVRLCHLSSTW